MQTRFTIGFVAITAGALVAIGAARQTVGAAAPKAVQAAPAAQQAALQPPAKPGEKLETPPPPFSEGIYPCSNCHKLIEPNRKRRTLEFHTEIVLKHDEEHRWCLDCHDANDRDVLHLANGDKLPFEESYLLCGQCHGEKLRDWRVGVHGRRVGNWNGQKQYLLCVNCHWPHEPRFKPLEPKPAPKRPTRPGGGN